MNRFLRELIKAKSVTGFEEPAQELLRDKLKELGATVDYWRPSRRDFKGFETFVSEEKDFHQRPNLVGRFGGSKHGDALAFNGHVDTVPEGDPKLWKHAPYGGRIENGKLYGRGACDMKGGLVATIFAVKALQDCGVGLERDIIVESVIGEESGGVGTLATIIRGHVPAAVVIAEPTNFQLLTSNVGCLMFRLKIVGKAAHGASRYLGVSAVEKFQPILNALIRLEEKRKKMKKMELYSDIPNPVTLSIGTVRAGNWDSTVPEDLVAEGRYGVWPGEALEHARKQFEDAVKTAASEDMWLSEHSPEIHWFGPQWESAELKTDHWLAALVSDSAREVFRRNPTLAGAAGGSDMRLFTNIARVPAVLYGPGEDGVAHFSDEYIALKDVSNACKVYAMTALAWSEREDR
jgi:acetylornithine deacetylase